MPDHLGPGRYIPGYSLRRHKQDSRQVGGHRSRRGRFGDSGSGPLTWRREGVPHARSTRPTKRLKYGNTVRRGVWGRGWARARRGLYTLVAGTHRQSETSQRNGRQGDCIPKARRPGGNDSSPTPFPRGCHMAAETRETQTATTGDFRSDSPGTTARSTLHELLHS